MVKAGMVAALALVLLVPIGMIRDLVAERQARRNEAVNGITEAWGKRQVITNPYILVTYERLWTEVRRETVNGKAIEQKNERSETRVLRLPTTAVEWTVSADVGEKARGIYKARLYAARLEGRGTIAIPKRASLEDGTSRYKWGAPILVIGISDPLGIRTAVGVQAAAALHPFIPGSGDGIAGLHARLPLQALWKAPELAYAISFDVAGSEAIAIAPMGADTAVALRADWPHPSFQGRFLPAKHDIGPEGFTASWRVSRFARVEGAKEGDHVSVSFVESAGLYQRLERASKYGFLFIGLTFAAFALFELLRRLAIHPVQYGLVGLALAMFFLLLAALSEHIAFAAAYAIATAGCAGVITAYLARVLQSVRLALAFGAGLGALYAILYVLLQAEDYALLGGTLVLFGLLAAVMLATRRVDWYRLTPPKEQSCSST
jgi:inner membrane protein